MQYALTFPSYRAVAVGGLLLALSVAGLRSKPHMHRLALHAVAQPDALYLTAWRDGDVRVPIEGEKLVPLTFSTAAYIDGCRWRATEKLVPINDHAYAYAYREVLLGCEPDATPWLKTPRTGMVTVED